MKKAFTRLSKLKPVQSMTNAERIRRNSMATGLPWDKTTIFHRSADSYKMYVFLDGGGFTVVGKDLDDVWDKLTMDYFESLDLWTRISMILVDMIGSNLLYILSTDIQDNLRNSIKSLREYLSSGDAVEQMEVIKRFVYIWDILSIFKNQKEYWQISFVYNQPWTSDLTLNEKNIAKLHEFLFMQEKILKR